MKKVFNDYYTYAFLREDKSPYYIGKGRGDRIYSKKRTINAPKDKSRIIFLKQNLTEEEAFKHERYMIFLYGRKDLETGILRNKTDGGEGSSGYIHTEEELKKMSEAMKGKMSGENNPMYNKKHTPEARKKQSEAMKGKMSGENNPFYGKKHTPETRKQMSEVKSGENNPNYGINRPEHSKRMSGENHPMYNKKHTPETRKKMSEARKKCWENKKLQETNK